MMFTRHMLLIVMQGHIGASHGATATALVKELRSRFGASGTERDLRHLVKELRLEGHHVCAHPTTGYHMAESAAELDRTSKFMVDRAMSELAQVAAMKRVSVPDLYGQMRIPYAQN